MRIIELPFFLLVFVVLSSCSSAENAQLLAKQAAEARFNDEVELIPNEIKSFVICSNRPKVRPGHPLRPLRFVVFDLDNKRIVYEDSLESADVYWLTNTRIQVHLIPEVISADEEPTGYMYDLISQTRHPFVKDH